MSEECINFSEEKKDISKLNFADNLNFEINDDYTMDKINVKI